MKFSKKKIGVFETIPRGGPATPSNDFWGGSATLEKPLGAGSATLNHYSATTKLDGYGESDKSGLGDARSTGGKPRHDLLDPKPLDGTPTQFEGLRHPQPEHQPREREP